MNENSLLEWSEALAGIARTGLAFTESVYERERFEEVLKVAAQMRYAAQEEPTETFVDDTFDAWIESVAPGKPGYVTPKVAIGAAVRKGNELLLIQRSDSKRWLYPTGWADVGYTPAEVAVKEVFEETGLRVKPIRPIAIFDSYRMGISRMAFYSLVFLCDYVEGELVRHELECLDLGWFKKDNLPSPLAGHHRWIDIVYNAIEDKDNSVYFDYPRKNLFDS